MRPSVFLSFLIIFRNGYLIFHVMSSYTADWKYRHAGLMALSAIGEGCHQQMEGILNEIVNFVLLFLQDPVSLMQLIDQNLLFNFCFYKHLLFEGNVISASKSEICSL